MAKKPKTNITTIQIPVPEQLTKCFLCGEPLYENGIWFVEQPLVGRASMFLFTCLQHREDAKTMIEGMEGFVALKRSNFKLPDSAEESKTE